MDKLNALKWDTFKGWWLLTEHHCGLDMMHKAMAAARDANFEIDYRPSLVEGNR